MRCAIVGPEGVVLEVIEADAGWQVQLGQTLVAGARANVGDLYDPVNGGFTTPPRPLAERQAEAIAVIQARRDALLARGAPYGGSLIDVSDKGRADLGGMATTAILAMQGALEWPESYARGWITQQNSRVTLPTPVAGIQLAAAVGNWYGALIQFSRDAKDQMLASDDPDPTGIAWEAFEASPQS